MQRQWLLATSRPASPAPAPRQVPAGGRGGRRAQALTGVVVILCGPRWAHHVHLRMPGEHAGRPEPPSWVPAAGQAGGITRAGRRRPCPAHRSGAAHCLEETNGFAAGHDSRRQGGGQPARQEMGGVVGCGHPTSIRAGVPPGALRHRLAGRAAAGAAAVPTDLPDRCTHDAFALTVAACRAGAARGGERCSERGGCRRHEPQAPASH